ncbi:protein of unknown function [Streptomyces sp. KY75]|nr:protein of unknown function [Streptomyces sp. KY70]CAD5988024.1 protein of unknown function [Streptomyces sp. KY75]
MKHGINHIDKVMVCIGPSALHILAFQSARATGSGHEKTRPGADARKARTASFPIRPISPQN